MIVDISPSAPCVGFGNFNPIIMHWLVIYGETRKRRKKEQNEWRVK